MFSFGGLSDNEKGRLGLLKAIFPILCIFNDIKKKICRDDDIIKIEYYAKKLLLNETHRLYI